MRQQKCLAPNGPLNGRKINVNPIFARAIKELCTISSAPTKVDSKGALKSNEKTYTAKVTEYKERAGALVEITDAKQTRGGNSAFKGKLALFLLNL